MFCGYDVTVERIKKVIEQLDSSIKDAFEKYFQSQ